MKISHSCPSGNLFDLWTKNTEKEFVVCWGNICEIHWAGKGFHRIRLKVSLDIAERYKLVRVSSSICGLSIPCGRWIELEVYLYRLEAEKSSCCNANRLRDTFVGVCCRFSSWFASKVATTSCTLWTKTHLLAKGYIFWSVKAKHKLTEVCLMISCI